MKIRIGAATIITMVMVLMIGGYGLYQQRRAAAQPPVIERTVQGATPHGIAPVPEFILRHRAALALTEAQTRRIRKIAAEYRKDIAPYQQRLETASPKYQQEMERAQTQQRLSYQQIQNAGGDLQRLSAVMVTTRHAYWQQARAILTVRQQAQLDGLASRAILQDLQ